MTLINCPECNHEVSTKASACPNCGAPPPAEKKQKKKMSTLDKIIYIIFGLVIIVVIFVSESRDDNQSTNTSYESSYTKSVDGEKKEALKGTVALVLNLNGLLCARIINITPIARKDTYEVTCVEYRDGTGRKKYVFNATKGTAYVIK